MGRERKTPPLYPVLDAKIKAMGGPCKMLRKTGLFYNSYYCMQTGQYDPSKITIDTLLAYTGLTYEEAFRLKE